MFDNIVFVEFYPHNYTCKGVYQLFLCMPAAYTQKCWTKTILAHTTGFCLNQFLTFELNEDIQNAMYNLCQITFLWLLRGGGVVQLFVRDKLFHAWKMKTDHRHPTKSTSDTWIP
ncbi:hypothetical protein HanPI659440_Chr16g0642691 [Helianthus annuus]|nr:hypothetical protein HanPI659440_Chr16g0642691 [Helianthus annuus]